MVDGITRLKRSTSETQAKQRSRLWKGSCVLEGLHADIECQGRRPQRPRRNHLRFRCDAAEQLIEAGPCQAHLFACNGNVDAPGAEVARLISQFGKPGRAVFVEILKRRD
jgi:hypothetical protein